MPTTALDITPVLLAATETTIIGPVPASTEYNLPVIRFVNNDSSDHTLTLWNKPTAAAGTDTEIEMKLYTIQARSTYEHGPMVLAAGRRISAQADASGKINAVVHGWATT
jgi:hypothetical protein